MRLLNKGDRARMSTLTQPEPRIFAGEAAQRFHRKTLVWDCLSLYYILDELYAQQSLDGGVNVVNATFGTEDEWETVLAQLRKGFAEDREEPAPETGSLRR
jgi:hypothetical protein